MQKNRVKNISLKKKLAARKAELSEYGNAVEPTVCDIN